MYIYSTRRTISFLLLPHRSSHRNQTLGSLPLTNENFYIWKSNNDLYLAGWYNSNTNAKRTIHFILCGTRTFYPLVHANNNNQHTHRIEIMKTLLAALLLYSTHTECVVSLSIERREMDTLLSVGVSQHWIKQTRDCFSQYNWIACTKSKVVVMTGSQTKFDICSMVMEILRRFSDVKWCLL